MEEENKVEETAAEVAEESTETEADEPKDETDWKAETAKYKRMAEQRGKKLEKFSSIEKEEDSTQKPQDKSSESNEPDYGRLAYLKAEGIDHPDDQKMVQDEANRLKLPLTEVRQMEHVKGRLQASKDQREALSGTPKGTGRSGGKTQHDVDYWLNKDGDERPSDPELAVKVLKAKMAKEKSANQYSDVMYN